MGIKSHSVTARVSYNQSNFKIEWSLKLFSPEAESFNPGQIYQVQNIVQMNKAFLLTEIRLFLQYFGKPLPFIF